MILNFEKNNLLTNDMKNLEYISSFNFKDKKIEELNEEISCTMKSMEKERNSEIRYNSDGNLDKTNRKMNAEEIFYSKKSNIISEEDLDYENDDIEDMNTIIKKLDFDVKVPKERDIFSLSNKYYEIFTSKFNMEIDPYLFNR